MSRSKSIQGSNGQTASAEKETTVVPKSLQKLENKLREATVKLQLKLVESQSGFLGDLVVPHRDPWLDPFHRDEWQLLGANARDRGKSGSQPEAFTTEEQLRAIRQNARHLATHNEFALNAQANRVAYVVGSGIQYTAMPFDEDVPRPELVKVVQAFINEQIRRSDWGLLEQEAVERAERDGECFIHRFPQIDGHTLYRFIEPENIRMPMDEKKEEWSYGIHTDPNDVVTVIEYNVHDQGTIAAESVRHIKINTDSTVKRGLSTYYPIRKNLERAEKLLRNMSLVAQIQSAIALVRKHKSPKGAIQPFVDDVADFNFTNPVTKRSHNFQQLIPPAIIDLDAGTEFDFPTEGVDAAKFVMILQAELRAVASRLVMPEFMLTSKSDDVNRASALVAESPAHKNFERQQNFYGVLHFKQEMWMAIQHAVSMSLLPVAVLTDIALNCNFPTLVLREFMKEQLGYEIQNNAKVLSRRTWAAKTGLNYEREAASILQENELDPQPTPFPPFGGVPDDDEDEDD